jgi:hypothetical protein
MFPGYLFASFDLAEMHRQVRYAHGVIGMVQFGGRYPMVDEEALVQLRDRIGAAESGKTKSGFSGRTGNRPREGACPVILSCVLRGLYE